MRKFLKGIVVVYILIIFLSGIGFAVPKFPVFKDFDEIQEHLNTAPPQLLSAEPKHYGANIAGLLSYSKVKMAIDYAKKAPSPNPDKKPMMEYLAKIAQMESNFRKDFAKVYKAYKTQNIDDLLKYSEEMVHDQNRTRYPYRDGTIMDMLYGCNTDRAFIVYDNMLAAIRNSIPVQRSYIESYIGHKKGSAWEGF